MLVMLVPSAVSPPSANSRACTTSTIAMHSAPTHGPTRMATSAPPSRWPLAPGRIGKLIIWTAKTNAVTRPAIGAVRSSRSARARLTAMRQPDRGDQAEHRGGRRVHQPVAHVHGHDHADLLPAMRRPRRGTATRLDAAIRQSQRLCERGSGTRPAPMARWRQDGRVTRRSRTRLPELVPPPAELPRAGRGAARRGPRLPGRGARRRALGTRGRTSGSPAGTSGSAASSGRRGWLGMTIPTEYGGHGASPLDRYVVTEELLAAGAPVAAHWIADRQIGADAAALRHRGAAAAVPAAASPRASATSGSG